jgi:hypothetical protein
MIDTKTDADAMAFLNLSRKKTLVPPLPTTLKACRALTLKRFEIVDRAVSEATDGQGYGKGGESATKLVLHCPLCSFEFDAVERANCFETVVTPENCPNCNFPKTLLTQEHGE